MKLFDSFITKIIIFGIVICIAGGGIWLWWKDGIDPADPNNTAPVSFVVKKGEGVRVIAQRLAQQNLIRSATTFYVLVKVMGLEHSIQAGDFRLSPNMNAQTIAQELTHGIVDTWVTVLEGWRVEEIATKLAKDLDIPEHEFLLYAKEGYMFPDTYLIPREATAAAVASMFADTFTEKFDQSLQAQAAQKGLTTEQVVTLASIVEREGHTDQDRPLIASVLLNRLKKKYPLQTDATVQYALGYQPYEKSWWKKSLTLDDLKLVSPYNTYINVGLPPHPIANPGLASLKAVVSAPDTEYFYYLHDAQGGAHFAVTLEEHNANVSKYIK